MEDKIIEAEYFSSLAKKRLVDTFIARNYDLPIANYIGMIEKIIEQNELKEVAWKTAMMANTDPKEAAEEDSAMLSPFFVPELRDMRNFFVLLSKVETQEDLITFKTALNNSEAFITILEVKEQEFWILAAVEWMTQIMRKMAFFFLDAPPQLENKSKLDNDMSM